MLAVVTPVKNEGKRLLDIASQLVQQKRMPDYWVIVDDNSTDVTSNIVKQLEKDYDFVLSVSLSKRSAYNEVFRYGHIVRTGFTYVLKYCRKLKFLGVLDADIKLKDNYYEAILRAFNKIPELGIASGLYLKLRNNAFCLESNNNYKSTVCGASMVFRKECLTDISGFPTLPRPDTAALLKATSRGWKVGVVSSTYAIHLRENRHLTKYLKLGIASYSLDYHPVNAILSGPYLALRNFSLSPLGFTIGYLIGAIYKTKVKDEEVKQYYRKSLIRRIYKILRRPSHKYANLDPIDNSTIII